MDQRPEEDPEEINRLVMAQRAAISNEIAANHAIISDVLPFTELQAEYAENPGFLIKIPVTTT